MPTWDVDWSPVPKGPPPGLYLVEIKEAESGRSKKSGDLYVRLKLVMAGDKSKVCDDLLMLEGEQRWSGQIKLGVFGFTKEKPPTGPEDLIGKRAWVVTKQREYRNELQACVDNRVKGSKQGYWPENEKPEIAFPESIAPIDNWKRSDGTDQPVDQTPF